MKALNLSSYIFTLITIIACNGDSPIKQDNPFYVQLQGQIKTCPAEYCFFDLWKITKEHVTKFKSKHKKVICYFSAGTYEDWRSDKNLFPKKTIGKKLGEWKGEKWIDIRDASILKIMESRIKIAHDKGCYGVDPDNVDGFTNKTGFSLTKNDQIKYIKLLKLIASKYNLKIGLKNGGKMAVELAPALDWVLAEQCQRYKECNIYTPFIKLNKPVFDIEYENKYCKPFKGIDIIKADKELKGKVWNICN